VIGNVRCFFPARYYPSIVTAALEHSTQREVVHKRTTWVRLPAVVYYPEADKGDWTSEEEEEEEHEHVHEEQRWKPFMEDLSRNYVAPLAQLAVPFCPTKGLALENIEHIEVIGLNEHQLTLQAIVCDGDCVALSIPVPFPRHCHEEDGFEKCVIDNLAELYDTVQAKEKVDKQRQALHQSTEDLEYPSWWVSCDDQGELDKASKDVCNLMNEDDFQEELQVFVGNMFLESDTIIAVAVVSVGTTGLLLRAAVSDGSDDVVFDIPVSFEEPACSVDELHAAVLETVESCSQ